MKRKLEIWIMLLLPILICGLLILNTKVMSAHYTTLNGFNQASKVYSEQITVVRQALEGKPGQTLSINVIVKNKGNFIWVKDGPNVVHLSYHVLDANTKAIISEGLRVALPHDIRPDQQVTLPLKLQIPEQPGNYIVQLDMVQEGVTWFGDKGGERYPVGIVGK
jgi:hypothetical protein